MKIDIIHMTQWNAYLVLYALGKKDIVAVLLPKKELSQQPEDHFLSLSGSTSAESPGTPSRGNVSWHQFSKLCTGKISYVEV